MAPTSNTLETAYSYALHLIDGDMCLRRAVDQVRKERNISVTKSSLKRRAAAIKVNPANTIKCFGRRPALTLTQEKIIPETIRHFALRGVPIVKEEVATLVESSFGHDPNVRRR